MIRYSTQCIEDDDIQAVVQALKSDYLTQGPLVETFEKEICRYTGGKFALSVSSATTGLHLACLAIGINEQSLVWTSPNSFCASSNAALYCGAKVDFVDIDSQTYNISVEALEEKLTDAQRNNQLPTALIVVHFAGQSCDMKKIAELGKKFGFKIIEDASHALGASYNKKKVGSCEFSEIAVFSFHPVKMITTGEGGMITTNNEELYSHMKALRTHGIVRNPSPKNGPWFYEQKELGFNYRMTEIQAALGVSQLKKLDRFVTRRREIASIYNDKLKGLPIQLPSEIETSKMSYHLYVVRLQGHAEQKNAIFKNFEQKSIGLQVHYIPIYRHPFYAQMGFKPENFPAMENYYAETMSIPDHPMLTEAEQNFVIQSLREILI